MKITSMHYINDRLQCFTPIQPISEILHFCNPKTHEELPTVVHDIWNAITFDFEFLDLDYYQGVRP